MNRHKSSSSTQQPVRLLVPPPPLQQQQPDIAPAETYRSQNNIILPTHPILFSELSTTFPVDLLSLSIANTTTTNPISRPRLPRSSLITPAPKTPTSTGGIPAASQTRTGIPFEDGFPCYIHPSPPPRRSAQKPIADSNSENLKDPNPGQFNHYVNHHRAGLSSAERQQSEKLEGHDHDRSQEDQHVALESVDQQIHDDDHEANTPSSASISDQESNSLTLNKRMKLHRSFKHPTNKVDTETGRGLKETWLTDLKIFYRDTTNRIPTQPSSSSSSSSSSSPSPFRHFQSSTSTPYPQIGQTFETLQKFKEACLLASWSAGHDMHVRNHYKNGPYQRCIFTCRYDRSPPKGLNCAFKIVALGQKTNELEEESAEFWKVIKCHLNHRNHQVRPGSYDPMGKRAYRKRIDRENGLDGTAMILCPQRKRGRPVGSKNIQDYLPALSHSTHHGSQTIPLASSIDSNLKSKEKVKTSKRKAEVEIDEKVKGDDESFSIDQSIPTMVINDKKLKSSVRPRRSLVK